MSLLAFFLALAVFLSILLSIPIEFRVIYRRVKQDDSAVFQLAGFFGLWKYKVDVPMLDWRWAFPPYLKLETVSQPKSSRNRRVKEEVKPRNAKLHGILARFFRLLDKGFAVKRWFYRGIRCRHLRWIMEVGCKDAADTGLAVGGLWSAMGYYVGKLQQNITFQVAKPQVAVYPSFDRPQWRVDFDCIFSVRFGHIIIAGFKVLKIVKLVLRG